MKTQIIKFWNCFLSIQMDIINANSVRNLELRENLFQKLFSKAVKIHPEMSIIIHFLNNGDDSIKLIFLPRDNYKLKAIAARVIAAAPNIEPWQYEIGIKPYNHSVISLCAENNFINSNTIVYQIYFAVQKIYITSNKLHLLIYLEMNKQHSKAELHQAMDSILIWFLGDAFYYKHISRFKIIRRKYSKINFIPMDELKNIIQYKALN